MVSNEKMKKTKPLYSSPCSLGEIEEQNKEKTLKDVYSLIAELWNSPPENNKKREKIKKDAEKVIKKLKNINSESAELLSKFLNENKISEEDYIDLFELDPECPLYLGSHTYDEPKTCANAAVSDRNKYMIELNAIYKHFGKSPNGKELSDFLPLVVDFLSLTVESNTDSVRGKLIREYLLPFLPPMRSKLKELKTPYVYLIDALSNIMKTDLKTHPISKKQEQKMEGSYVG